MGKPKSFRATLEPANNGLGWVIARLPFNSAKLWGSRGQIKIKGELNGFPIASCLFPDGKGGHYLLVNRTMQKGGKVQVGDAARFRMDVDTVKREAVLPPELEAILNEERALKRWYGQLNHATRNYIGKWIVDVKSDEARARRADQIAERLFATMEAERELPPVLKIAFANDPAAEAAWKKLSPSHRRSHLLAIFYYRDPQARARRIAKVLNELRRPGRDPD